MNKNTGIIIGVIALVVIVGGIYASTNSKDAAMMAKEAGFDPSVQKIFSNAGGRMTKH